MFICYDLAFPETIRAFALQGATIAALTTAWPMKGDDPATDYYGYTYDILSRANALSNQLWMVCSNQVDRPPTPGCANYYGHSRIVAPTGKIVAEIGHEEGLVTATVDLQEGLERGRTLDFFGLNLLRTAARSFTASSPTRPSTTTARSPHSSARRSHRGCQSGRPTFRTRVGGGRLTTASSNLRRQERPTFPERLQVRFSPAPGERRVK